MEIKLINLENVDIRINYILKTSYKLRTCRDSIKIYIENKLQAINLENAEIRLKYILKTNMENVDTRIKFILKTSYRLRKCGDTNQFHTDNKL